MSLSLLIDLPAELLHQTISYFDSENLVHRNSLYNLCLSSRLLCLVAQPVLFNHFELSRCSSNVIAWDHERCCIERMLLFATTVVQRPDLALKIRRINLDTTVFLMDDVFSLMTASHLEMLSNAAANAFIKPPNWIEQLKTNGFYTLATLIVHHLPNLKEARFQLNVPDLPVLSLDTQDRTPPLDCLRRLLPSLSTLHLTNPTTFYDLFHPQLQQFLALSTLRTLRLSDCHAYKTPLIASPTPCLYTITHLSLIESCINGRHLTSFLASFRTLRAFQYHDDSQDNPDHHRSTPGDIALALAPHARTLTWLDLDLGPSVYDKDIIHVSGGWCISHATYLTTGSLAHLSALRYLKIDLVRLGDVRNIPPSVEVLWLEEQVYDHDEALRAVFISRLARLRSLLPRVRKVGVGFRQRWESWYGLGARAGGVGTPGSCGGVMTFPELDFELTFVEGYWHGVWEGFECGNPFV